jgi:translation initiation factor 2 subunit 2
LVDGGEVAPLEDAEEAADLDFLSLKKKKKKRVIEAHVAELDAQLEEAGLVVEKDTEVQVEDGEEQSQEDEEAAWLKSDRDYTYDEVLPLPKPVGDCDLRVAVTSNIPHFKGK